MGWQIRRRRRWLHRQPGRYLRLPILPVPSRRQLLQRLGDLVQHKMARLWYLCECPAVRFAVTTARSSPDNVRTTVDLLLRVQHLRPPPGRAIPEVVEAMICE